MVHCLALGSLEWETAVHYAWRSQWLVHSVVLAIIEMVHLSNISQV